MNHSPQWQAGPPKPFPLSRIAITVFLMICFSAFALYLKSDYLFEAVRFGGGGYIIAVLCMRAYEDNLRTKLTNIRLSRVIPLSLIIWVPFAVILAPGVLLTLYLDKKIEFVVEKAESSAADRVKVIDEQVKGYVEHLESVQTTWWWPPDWFKSGQIKVQREVVKTVKKNVLEPAPHGIRVAFLGLKSILRVSQILFYCSITSLIIRSYLFFLARSALFAEATIEFTIP